MSRPIFVGDVQGCAEELEILLARGTATFGDAFDLWIVGDVVNRGPKSLKVLRWMKAHEDCVVMVLGNHELHLLALSCGARGGKDRDTFKKTLKASDRDELLDWLRQLADVAKLCFSPFCCLVTEGRGGAIQ